MNSTIPLAERLRPKHWQEVVGQPQLLDADSGILRKMIESAMPRSLIFWGPPGVGKTTLARLVAQAWGAQVLEFSGAKAHIKDVRLAVEDWMARQGRGTPYGQNAVPAHDDLFQVASPSSLAPNQSQDSSAKLVVFVDELHRYNKAQQDFFLPWVEQGLFILIGATTENPGFEINNALLSRCALMVLEPLSLADLEILLHRALAELQRPLSIFSESAKTTLLHWADGDARRLLNDLETLVRALPESTQMLSSAELMQKLGRAQRRFDDQGDIFYDQISALHKAVRGSDINASLYWFVRMIDGGCDPLYIARRMIRMAVEDVGLADPQALTHMISAVQAYERLGSPEGELALAQMLIYLAALPKSNAVYRALNTAKQFVREDGTRPVPLHLRNAPTKVHKSLGAGAHYRYAHDEPEAYAAGEHYFPEGLTPQKWYQPSDRGLEKKIAERLKFLAELDRKAKDSKT